MDKELKLSPDLAANILWQYDQAKNLTGLISSKQIWYDSNWESYWDNWYTSVFNLKTANRFGCVVWAIILNIPIELVYNSAQTGSRPPFGFGGGRENFDGSNFFGSEANSTLSLDEARKLLRIRYYAQTMSTSITNINGMLKDIFADDGLAYIEETVGGIKKMPFGFGLNRSNFNAPSNFNTDGSFGNIKAMIQRYIFTFPLSDNFKAALQTYLPRGSGVQTISTATA